MKDFPKYQVQYQLWNEKTRRPDEFDYCDGDEAITIPAVGDLVHFPGKLEAVYRVRTRLFSVVRVDAENLTTNVAIVVEKTDVPHGELVKA